MLDKLMMLLKENKYKQLGVTKKTAQSIIDATFINKFWQIQNSRGVGKGTYAKMFVKVTVISDQTYKSEKFNSE